MPLGEFSIIDHYFARHGSGRDDVLLGIGDDAAILQPRPGAALVAAVDTLLAGRHFPLDTAPEAIAHKALAVNLSDLAAMGAEPAWFTLSLALPEADSRFLEAFASGLFALADAHGIELVGGDTVCGPLAISVQVLGQLEAGRALRRDGARAGDRIFVSATLGDGAAGLALYPRRGEGAAVDTLIARLERPTPRLALGQALQGVATAAIDISDGLLADLGHILSASRVGAEIALEQLPLSTEARELFSAAEAQRFALQGGDDYELCFCVAEGRVAEVAEVAERLGLPLSEVGRIVAGEGITLMDGTGRRMAAAAAGYDHFAGGDSDSGGEVS